MGTFVVSLFVGAGKFHLTSTSPVSQIRGPVSGDATCFHGRPERHHPCYLINVMTSLRDFLDKIKEQKSDLGQK